MTFSLDPTADATLFSDCGAINADTLEAHEQICFDGRNAHRYA
jgi:hypothetical protein